MTGWMLFAAGALNLLGVVNALWPFAKRWPRSLIASYVLQLMTAEVVPLQAFATLLTSAALVLLGALDAWPGVCGAAFEAVALLGLGLVAVRARRSTERAIAAAFPGGPRLHSPPLHWRLRPYPALSGAWTEARDVSYGPAGWRNTLDVQTPRGAKGAPVLVWIHGGGWVIGEKRHQGRPLREAFLQAGWVCVSVNYRLSPRTKWPAHLDDCTLALQWLRAHLADYGGDPSRMVVSGGSAGGHLAALVALEPSNQLRACVAMYGAFSPARIFTHHRERGRAARIARAAFGAVPWEHPEAYATTDAAARANADAPPFLIIHGTDDLLVPAPHAAHFADALRARSKNPVVHVELPGGIHAFDVVRSWRTGLAVQAALWFAQQAVADQPQERTTTSNGLSYSERPAESNGGSDRPSQGSS